MFQDKEKIHISWFSLGLFNAILRQFPTLNCGSAVVFNPPFVVCSLRFYHGPYSYISRLHYRMCPDVFSAVRQVLSWTLPWRNFAALYIVYTYMYMYVIARYYTCADTCYSKLERYTSGSIVECVPMSLDLISAVSQVSSEFAALYIEMICSCPVLHNHVVGITDTILSKKASSLNPRPSAFQITCDLWPPRDKQRSDVNIMRGRREGLGPIRAHDTCALYMYIVSKVLQVGTSCTRAISHSSKVSKVLVLP